MTLIKFFFYFYMFFYHFFLNNPFNKNKIKSLLYWLLFKYGNSKVIFILEKLKYLGLKYVTSLGISLGLSDFKVPYSKFRLIKNLNCLLSNYKGFLLLENFLFFEKVPEVLNWWNITDQLLKEEVLISFRQFNLVNPLYAMIVSGARGNIIQIKQIVGMRGLILNSFGEIVNFPVKNNLLDGLNSVEYFVSCYGARKGIVDTALKTANSGYLTRKLIYVAQNVLVKAFNCNTNSYSTTTFNFGKFSLYKFFKEDLIGRVISKDIIDLSTGFILFSKGQDICFYILRRLLSFGISTIFYRSPFTCDLNFGLCQFCYGVNFVNGKLAELGEPIGILAAQSIGEPGTQLTMRTFHTGGVFSSEVSQTVVSPHRGKVFCIDNFSDLIVSSFFKNYGYLNSKEKYVIIKDSEFNKSLFRIPKNSILFFKNGEYVNFKQILLELPYTESLGLKCSIINDYTFLRLVYRGKIIVSNKRINSLFFGFFLLFIEKLQVFMVHFLLIDHFFIVFLKNTVCIANILHIELRSRFFLFNKKFSSSYIFSVLPNSFENKKFSLFRIASGYRFFKTSQSYFNFVSSFLSFCTDEFGFLFDVRQTFFVFLKTCCFSKRNTIFFSNISFYSNFFLRKGVIKNYFSSKLVTEDITRSLKKVDSLFEAKTIFYPGIDLNSDLLLDFYSLRFFYSLELSIKKSVERIRSLILFYLQVIYRSHEISILSKHIELVIREMTKRVIILFDDNSYFLPGQVINLLVVFRLSEFLLKNIGYLPVVLGITNIVRLNDSFVTGFCFQELAKHLVYSTITGKIDWLRGIRENSFLGNLVLFGTGWS